MAETKKLITKYQRLNTARQILESVSEPANNAYYVFIGNHLDYSDPTNIPQPLDNVSETTTSAYRNMMYGKRITQKDMALVINRNDYVSGTVYAMYDDNPPGNVSIFDTNFYTIVDAGSFSHVFKCIDNNSGSPSTAKPNFSDIDIGDQIYQTSDNYVWHYMYSADAATVSKFSTSTYFPVVPNTAMTAAAVDGMIEVVKVEAKGKGYDNYCTGTFRNDDIKVLGQSKVFSLNASLTASSINNFYNGCYIYIIDGTGKGQYAEIVTYIVTPTQKLIYLRNEFAVSPSADSVYEISPKVEIRGDGKQTVEATGRAIINSATGNSVQRVQLLDLGAGYKYATAKVLADSTVPVTTAASVRPIFSPQGGHGYDAAAELGATRISISTKLSNTDIDIPQSINGYRTVGLLQDPVFSNVQVMFDTGTSTGIFLPDEKVYRVNGVRIANNISMNTSTAILTGSQDFVNQLSIGEYIYLKTTDGYQLTTVKSIVNSSYMTIESNGYYNSTSASLYKTNMSYVVYNNPVYTQIGTMVSNSGSTDLHGKGTDIVSTVTLFDNIFVYANSTGGGDIVSVSNIYATTATFNSNASVNSTAETISPSVTFAVNDLVQYYTSSGNTVLSGLTNTSYYFVVSASGANIALSATRGGTAINLTANVIPTKTFNAKTAVDGTNEFITVASHPFVNGDVIIYYTAASNTAVSGLSNNSSYYVVNSNTAGIKVSLSSGGTPINITASATSETGHYLYTPRVSSGHYLKMQKLSVNTALTFTNTTARVLDINYDEVSRTIPGSQSTSADVRSVFTGEIFLDNLSGIISQGDFLIGANSGATGIITSIKRNDVVKNFDTFVQMGKYTSTVASSSSFQLNELVYQSETGNLADQFANGYLCTIVYDGTKYAYYLTNETGVFDPAQNFNLIGATSKAFTGFNYKYLPELVPGSGKVLFIEKLDVIPRSTTSAETIKFILEF
jgi:hypothetical protein